MISRSAPAVDAPDSPEMTRASPGSGFPSTRMPPAAALSGMDRKASAYASRIRQLTVEGSPQARPAMIVGMSPVTKRSLPSSARAVSRMQSAAFGSTITLTGRASPCFAA